MSEELENYKCFNKHPTGKKVKDCVVRAIATALDMEYNELRRDLNAKRKEWGMESYKGKEFIYKYLSKYNRLTIFGSEKGKSRIKGNDFTRLFPDGIYILKMLNHITVCIDGVIYDTWDCRGRSVYTAWEVKNMYEVGNKIKIIYMDGEPHYNGKSGVITSIDSIGQIHGTWGGVALNPSTDKFEIEEN